MVSDCIAMVQPDESSKCSNTSFSYRPRETVHTASSTSLSSFTFAPTPPSAASQAPFHALQLLGVSMSSTFVTVNYTDHQDFALGCTDGIWGTNSSVCRSAAPETNPWISAKVKAESYISTVLVYGHADLLNEFEVFVSNSSGDPEAAASTRCGSVNTSSSPLTPSTARCDLTGSFVALRLPGKLRVLVIEELVVFGIEAAEHTPSAAALLSGFFGVAVVAFTCLLCRHRRTARAREQVVPQGVRFKQGLHFRRIALRRRTTRILGSGSRSIPTAFVL